MRAFLRSIWAFIRKHGRAFISAGILVLCLLVFFVFWMLEVRVAQDKSKSVYLNDLYEETTASLANDATLSQTFEWHGSFHALGVMPVYGGNAPPGRLKLDVYDGNDTLLGTVKGKISQTLSGTYAVFVFEDTLVSPDGHWRIELSVGLNEGDAIAFAKSTQAGAGWALAENGEAANGSLCLLAATDKIGPFISGYYWLFAVLGSIVCAGLFFLAGLKNFPLHRLVATSCMAVGLLFCLILPPYSAPDEEFHINESFFLSAALSGDAETGHTHSPIVRRAGDENPIIQDKDTSVFTYRELANTLFEGAPTREMVRFEEDEGVAGYQLLYWPSALAISLCRLFGAGFTFTLYLGRLVNLALFSLLACFAVKLAPCGKSVFAAVSLLPITLHLAASFNRDGLTIALYMFYTALCLYYALEKPTLTTKDILLLAVTALIAGPSKEVYAPVLFLCLFIPWQKLHLFGKPLSKRVARLVKIIIPLLGCLSLLITVGIQIYWTVYSLVIEPQEIAEAMEAAGPNAKPWHVQEAATFTYEAENADDIVFGPWDIFRQPGTIILLLARTLFTQFMSILQAMLGGNLGYNSLPLSWGFVVVLLVLLAVAVLPDPGEKRPGRWLRLTGGVIALGVSSLIVLVCIIWTPTYMTTLYGLQGRYFLPVLPLALVCAAPWGRPGSKGLKAAPFALQKNRDLSKPLAVCFAATSVFALLNAFLLILER